MRDSSIATTIADLEQRREKITRALDALRSLADLPVADEGKPEDPSAAKRGPKPGTGLGRPARKVGAESWILGRTMWDTNDSAEKIGKTIGCSGARVNQYAKEKGWPARDYSIIARKARLRVPGTGVKAKPRVAGVACPKCHMISPTDPCYNCGRPKSKKQA